MRAAVRYPSSFERKPPICRQVACHEYGEQRRDELQAWRRLIGRAALYVLAGE